MLQNAFVVGENGNHAGPKHLNDTVKKGSSLIGVIPDKPKVLGGENHGVDESRQFSHANVVSVCASLIGTSRFDLNIHIESSFTTDKVGVDDRTGRVLLDQRKRVVRSV